MKLTNQVTYRDKLFYITGFTSGVTYTRFITLVNVTGFDWMKRALEKYQERIGNNGEEYE